MNNQEFKIRSKIVGTNSNEPLFYLYSIEVNKCSCSCNNTKKHKCQSIQYHVKKETRHIEWHKTCKRKCRLDTSVCNNKQRWNKDKCRCKCKEFIDNGRCDKVFIWNPSNCKCDFDTLCDVRKYLDYKNCKCRKKLDDKLVV